MSLVTLLGLFFGTRALAIDAHAGLTDELTRLQREGNVPAMGLVLLDARRPVVIAAWGDEIDADTPFRWGSITKTFTAIGLLRLVEQRQMGLDTPLRTLVSDGTYYNPWQRTHPVRLGHLLELTAGFTDLSALEFNFNEPLSLAEAMQLNPATRRAAWPPGVQHVYSNSTPGLTALAIEAISDQRFEKFMREHVFAPLGMANATLEPVAGLPGGFKADGTTPIPYWHMTFRAFGAMNASTAELANALTALLNGGELPDGGRLLSKTNFGRLFRAHTGIAGEHRLPVSYGAGSYGWVSHGTVFYGHGGDADGYRSRYGLLPEAGRGYAIIINVDNIRLLRRMQRRIEAYLTRDLEHPPTPTVAAAASEEYAGSYYPAGVRFGLEQWNAGKLPKATVTLAAAGLRFEYRGRVTSLLATPQAGHFRRPDDPVATVIFARDAAGSLHLQGELGNFVSLQLPPCPGFIPVCVKQ